MQWKRAKEALATREAVCWSRKGSYVQKKIWYIVQIMKPTKDRELEHVHKKGDGFDFRYDKIKQVG